MASIRRAKASKSSSKRWPYTVSVNAAERWPMIDCTAFGEAPAEMIRAAAE